MKVPPSYHYMERMITFEMFEDFRNYLLIKAAVGEKVAPYYCKWIEECYGFCKEPQSHALTFEHKQAFLRHVSKTREDWQVKQADTALRFYQVFLSSCKQTSSLPTSDTENEWNQLEGRARQVLRLKHRSLSTEKSYLGWLGMFRGFARGKAPSALTGADVQEFLSSLAVERQVSPATQNQALNALVFLFRSDANGCPDTVTKHHVTPPRALLTDSPTFPIEDIGGPIIEMFLSVFHCVTAAG